MNGSNNMRRGPGHVTYLAVPQSGDLHEAGRLPLKLSSDRTWTQRQVDRMISLIKVTDKWSH